MKTCYLPNFSNGGVLIIILDPKQILDYTHATFWILVVRLFIIWNTILGISPEDINIEGKVNA